MVSFGVVLSGILLGAAAGAPESEGVLVPAAIVRQALEANPEYARARAEVEAERARIQQADALPDPTLTLGIQNDGFKGIEIGDMETSYWQIMITQPLPWPGKRDRRRAVARAQASAAEAQIDKLRLGVVAEVERAYLAILLTRGQLALLDRLEKLWQQAEYTVRSRYEVGAASQSDFVRVQLERTRLRRQRIAREAAERVARQALNRLRARPLDEPVSVTEPLSEAPWPALPPLREAVAEAMQRSPDLISARRAVVVAEERVASARQERWPDLNVSAGIMPRGGLDPMWQASVGITLPIFSRKESVVVEGEHRREAERRGEEAVRQIIALRVRERIVALEAALNTLRLYREGLLVQSETAVQSTLAQYRVGRAPFTAVLEVMRGLVSDEGAYLEAMAEAHQIAIALREVSLEAPRLADGGASGGGGAMPSVGGAEMASNRRSANASRGSEAVSPAPNGSSNGGMNPGM